MYLTSSCTVQIHTRTRTCTICEFSFNSQARYTRTLRFSSPFLLRRQPMFEDQLGGLDNDTARKHSRAQQMKNERMWANYVRIYVCTRGTLGISVKPHYVVLLKNWGFSWDRIKHGTDREPCGCGRIGMSPGSVNCLVPGKTQPFPNRQAVVLRILLRTDTMVNATAGT